MWPFVWCAPHDSLVLLQLVGEFDVVVNCAGLGSLRFLKDDKVVPIKGQLLKVRTKIQLCLFCASCVCCRLCTNFPSQVTAPWIKMAIYNMDTDTYIVPGSVHCFWSCCPLVGAGSCVFSLLSVASLDFDVSLLFRRDWVNIGGTHDVGAFDPTVSEEDGRAIWERATQLVPALKVPHTICHFVTLTAATVLTEPLDPCGLDDGFQGWRTESRLFCRTVSRVCHLR